MNDGVRHAGVPYNPGVTGSNPVTPTSPVPARTRPETKISQRLTPPTRRQQIRIPAVVPARSRPLHGNRSIHPGAGRRDLPHCLPGRQRLAAEAGPPYVGRRHLPAASRERHRGKFPFRSGRRLPDRGNHRRAGGWLGKCTGQAAIIPHPPHRTPVPGCDRHVRRIVSLRQLAVQHGVDPHIGAPPAIRGVWLRPGTRRRPGRGGPLGGQLQRLLAGPGRHGDVYRTARGTRAPSPGRRTLAAARDQAAAGARRPARPRVAAPLRRTRPPRRPYRTARYTRALSPRRRALARPGTRRRPGRGGPLGRGLQRLFAGPGLHDVAIEQPGIRGSRTATLNNGMDRQLYWALGPRNSARPVPWHVMARGVSGHPLLPCSLPRRSAQPTLTLTVRTARCSTMVQQPSRC